MPYHTLTIKTQISRYCGDFGLDHETSLEVDVHYCLASGDEPTLHLSKGEVEDAYIGEVRGPQWAEQAFKYVDDGLLKDIVDRELRERGGDL